MLMIARRAFLQGLLLLTILFSNFETISIATSGEIKLFRIQRSKNKNEVHYVVNVNEDCTVMKDDAIRGFWNELEKGINFISGFGPLDNMAYGIASTEIKTDNEVVFALKAVPTKLFTVKTEKGSSTCLATTTTLVNNSEASLFRIYVESEEGLILPKVLYIDLFGMDIKGNYITERFTPK